MNIKILTIGKVKKKYISTGVNDFLERLSHYCKIEMIELKEPAKSVKSSESQIIQLEAEKIQSKLSSRDFVIAMDRSGEMVTSESFAHFLQERMNQSQSSLVFIIGGELGLNKKILQRSHKILSLSKMTFTHDMSRLILLEQLYRGFTILAGQKYHK